MSLSRSWVTFSLISYPVSISLINNKKQATLSQILVKRIIVNPQGEIMDQELNSPFAYLRSLVEDFQNQELCGSDHVRSGS
jgi:hypothetical protein